MVQAEAIAFLLVEALGAGVLLAVGLLEAIVFLVHRIVLLYTKDARYSWTGALLAGGTANLVAWGVTGQSDVLALAFSVAAFERYSVWRESRQGRTLVWSGVFIALSIFTKQSFIAVGAVVSLMTFLDDRRTGLKFVGFLAPAGVAVALALNALTGGYYFDNAILANLNPFAWDVFGNQINYFVNAC